jgi:serine/threonine protein kinase
MDRMKGITDKTFIAKGTYGKVYAISLTKDTPISDVQIPKIEKDIGFGPASLSYDEKMTSFKEEITKQKILGDELSPIIFDEHICEQDGVIIGRIIMEKMDGHLGEFIEQYGLEEDHLTEILKLVQRMHQKKVAHRDLRLENILFKRDPQTGTIIFKIIDFGLSHYFEDPSEVAMGGTNFQGNFDRGNFAQQSSKDFVHFLSSLEDSYGLKIELAMSDKTIRSGHFADPHFVGRELRQIKQIRTAIDLGAVGMIKGKMMAAISPVQMVPYDDDTISFVREGKLRRLNGKKIRVQL